MVLVFTYLPNPRCFEIENSLLKVQRNKNTLKRDVQVTFIFNIGKNLSKRDIKTTTGFFSFKKYNKKIR